MPATIVFTADTYVSAYGALSDILYERGMVGTVYFDPFRIGAADRLGQDQLTGLKQLGWGVDPYLYGVVNGSDVNMVSFYKSQGRVAANARLRDIFSACEDAGFRPATAAASQRAWSMQLANLARGRFKGVRVASGDGFESYPLADPCCIGKGLFDSLQSSTSVAALFAKIEEAILVGGLLPIVVHNVGKPANEYTVDPAVVEEIADFVAAKRSAGALRVCTMEQALTAP